MEVLIPLALFIYAWIKSPKTEAPPTRLNPEGYHDTEAFCQRYYRIIGGKKS